MIMTRDFMTLVQRNKRKKKGKEISLLINKLKTNILKKIRYFSYQKSVFLVELLPFVKKLTLD